MDNALNQFRDEVNNVLVLRREAHIAMSIFSTLVNIFGNTYCQFFEVQELLFICSNKRFGNSIIKWIAQTRERFGYIPLSQQLKKHVRCIL